MLYYNVVHFLECVLLYSHVADFALRSTSCEGSPAHMNEHHQYLPI